MRVPIADMKHDDPWDRVRENIEAALMLGAVVGLVILALQYLGVIN